LEELETVADGAQEITVRQLRDVIGKRAFAPLLLLASLLGFTPFGVVPGVPTALAVFVIIVAGQIAIGCRTVWAPSRLLALHVKGHNLQKATQALQPFARTVDKIIRPRLSFLTEPPYSSAIAITCILLALTIPPFELVPLVDMPLWAAMVAFSLALFAHDGVLAIVAFALTATGIYLIFFALF
jgi:hypothetical protein